MQAVFIMMFSVVFAACGIIGEKGTNQSGSNLYYEAEEIPRTDIPAEYSSDNIVDLYPVPPLDTAADETLIDPDQLPLPTPITNDAEAPVQLQALGDNYWVLVKETPSQVWAKLKQFVALKDLELKSEVPSKGIIDVTDSNGILYRFNVKQGLQRKSAEISLRTLLAGTATANFPATSTDRQLEVDTLEALTLFLSGHEAQTAYSYAALGISTIKRIAIKRNSDSGIKYLLVTEQEMRTKASLKQALTGANFQIVTLGQNSTVEARYMPQLPEEDQPGFFLRMFGVSAKLFDDEIEYAGETYIISLKAGETVQTISIDKDPSFEWESTSSKKRELNAILMMIKRSLY